jgi:hypothetical protein
MKEAVIILSVLLTFPIVALYGQNENEQDISKEVIEIELNNHYSIKLKQVSESEYTIQKRETEHLQHKPYKVITDLKETKKMLGNKLKEITVKDEEHYERNVLEITFKDKTKKRISWEWGINLENGFRAYYPEVGVLVFENEASGDYSIDLNDSKMVYERTGNPCYHAVSPDRKLRINGYYRGGAEEGVLFFLEKWNTKKKRYEFIASLRYENSLFYYSSDLFWTSNSKVLFRYGWSEDSYKYYEMEILIK